FIFCCVPLLRTRRSSDLVSVQMPLIYYLGYDAETADGQPISVYGGEQGILTVDIPAGFEGSIGIWHRGFWYWDMAVMISVVAWIDRKSTRLNAGHVSILC